MLVCHTLQVEHPETKGLFIVTYTNISAISWQSVLLVEEISTQ
jgi:hypothetical protein